MDADDYPTEPLAGVDSGAHPDLDTLPSVRRVIDIDGLTEHAPAAKVVRVVPASKPTSKAPASAATPGPEPDASEKSNDAPPAFGVVGGIQERQVRSHIRPVRARPPSAFKASRADTASAPPQSSTTPQASKDDQWYDTDGKPISVFRKRRLIQQGVTRSPHLGSGKGSNSGPAPADASSSANKSSPLEGVREQKPASTKKHWGPDTTRDPHGGAPPEAILQALQDSMDDGPRNGRKAAAPPPQTQGDFTDRGAMNAEDALLKNISDDNERLVASMSPAEVKEFLESVRGIVGADTLKKFANRRPRPAPRSASPPAEIQQKDVRKVPASAPTPQSVVTEQTARPGNTEPPKSPPSKSVRFSEDTSADEEPPLESHHAGHSSAGPNEPQFNRHGVAVSAAFAAGQDDTTDDNDVYATDDLLLLCRSSSAPQRRLFLSLTAQVLRLHGRSPPSYASEGKEKLDDNAPTAAEVWDTLIAKEAAVRAALVAGWQVGDNAFSVRTAALDLLAAAVDVLPEHLTARAKPPSAPAAGHISTPNEAAAALHHLGVVHKLSANVRSSPNSDQLFSVLTFLTSWSAAAAKAVTASSVPAAALTAAADFGGDHNQLAPLVLLDALVCYSSKAALSLLEAKPLGLQDVLLRILTTVDAKSILSDAEDQARALTAVRVLRHLSFYGLATDLAHLLWDNLSALLVQLTAHPSSAPTLLSEALKLLTSWTITSTDPHLTAGGHDVHFYTVREWPSYSLDAIRGENGQDVPAAVLAAACTHVRAALQGVHKHPDIPLPTTATPSSNDRGNLLRALPDLSARALDTFKSLGQSHAYQDASDALNAVSSALALAAEIEALPSSVVDQSQEFGRQLLAAKDGWDDVVTTPAWSFAPPSGVFSPRVAAARYICTLSTVATKGQARVLQRQLVLKLMGHLLPSRGEEPVAQYLACSLLDGAPILAPFYSESFRAPSLPTAMAAKEADAPALSGPSSHATVLGVVEPHDLRAYQTRASVFYQPPAERKKLDLPPELRPDPTEQVEMEDDDIDPATGNPFWRSLTCGLPARKDWPLSPLDELLHSANSAVFNRPGSLPPEWDFTEKQIVFATLALTADLFAPTGDSGSEEYLPSPADIWLGLMKVYLLESHASAPIGDKATGAVTGRDLFSDPGIASRMRKLAEWAVAEERAGGAPQETLEEAAKRQGIASFFQTYTDVLGVWDAQSLGDPTFALAVLQPTKMLYPSEYRLLLWRDYGHLLSTIRTALSEVNYSAFVQPYETDLAVLTHYAAALLRGQVTPANPLLWAVGTAHLAAALFAPDSSVPSPGRKQLTKMLFGPASPDQVAQVQRALLQWSDTASPPSEETVEARRKLVSSTISL